MTREHTANEKGEDVTREPYQGMLDLLLADLSPAEAESIIFPLMGHTWEAPAGLPESAPASLQQFRDLIAWRRFEAENPISRQLVCVHLLYRAAGSLGVEDNEASLTLMALARKGVKEVLLIWLGGRECSHCVELRDKLEMEQERK